MSIISENINNRFFEIWLEKKLIPDFENWVYSSTELKDQLDSDSYYEFLSLNYKNVDSHYYLKILIEKHITLSELEKWKMMKELMNVRERNKNASESILKFYTLHCKGYDFMDDLAFDFGLPLQVPYKFYSIENYEDLTESQREKIVDSYYPKILNEIDRVMEWIVDEKIILLGKSSEFGKLEYIDNRTESEKQRKDYFIKNTSSKNWWKFWE